MEIPKNIKLLILGATVCATGFIFANTTDQNKQKALSKKIKHWTKSHL